MPFRWGSNDCCSFAAAAVEAITAIDLMASVEPYATELGALRRITEAGGLKALASQYLGEAVSPLMAGVGDVVLVMNEGREMLGICNGVNVMAPGADGMVALSMNTAVAAWRI
jgi:phosphoribosylformylglycinamidine (FGAM) synthase-like amidotransferase family enzyme